MSEECPTCKGPVEIDEVLRKYGRKYIEHKKVYRSTAAEQLEEQEKETELYVARTTFLAQQLADKERELKKAEKQIYNAHLDNRLAQGKLTATNAVVEAAGNVASMLVIEKTQFGGMRVNIIQHTAGTWLRAVKNLDNALRKLQGGDGK